MSWDGVAALAVDQSSGVVKSGQPAVVLCDPSGKFVYVGNSDTDATGSSWANLAAFTVSTATQTAGQLVPSGIGTLELDQPSVVSSAMAVVE